MMDGKEDSTDVSSIKPVSSLRSRFENLGKDSVQSRQPSFVTKPMFLSVENHSLPSRPSTSASDHSPATWTTSNDGSTVAHPHLRRLGQQRSRPQSMVSVTPSRDSPLLVSADSPERTDMASPTRHMSIDYRTPSLDSSSPAASVPLLQPDSSTKPTQPVIAQAASVNPMPPASSPIQPLRLLEKPTEALRSRSPTPEIPSKSSNTAGPPPVNRAGKPSVPKKPKALTQKPEGAPALAPAAEVYFQDKSPFNSVPSSGTSTPDEPAPSLPIRHRNGSEAPFSHRIRGDSDASFVERLRSDSEASSVQRTRGDSDTSFAAARSRAQSNASFVESSSLPENHVHHWNPPPPTHHYVAARREQQAKKTTTFPARYKSVAASEVDELGNSPEQRPRLPSRPELQARGGRKSPPHDRSGRTSPVKALHIHKSAVHDTSKANRIPAIKSNESALSQGFDRTASGLSQSAPHAAPAVPAPRRSADHRRDVPSAPSARMDDSTRAGGDQPAPISSTSNQTVGPSDFPDSSRASRRPPKYRQRPHHIHTEYDTRTFAVCGEYVVTTGHHTKAWNLQTGEQVLDMMHNEIVKVSSLAFKPSPNIDDEGKRIWIGTSSGEIHEIDIPSQSMVKTKTHAHSRREVIRMFRYTSELWTLDDGGDLNVWKPDHKGMPSLDSQCVTYRTSRGHTFSIALGRHLWIATGKDIRVFAPSAQTDSEFQILRQPLNQPGTGEIHSGAMLSTKPDLVYFGHLDGKVSIYNRHNFTCTEVVNVSMYKLSSLAGVGDYLWAGFHTGMVYVYDTSVTPWVVKKDWKAHDKQISGMFVDRSAIWKLDRLQVVTLGADCTLRIWDGMLEVDWLESQMQKHDNEYCSFRELTAAVLTWNAGAAKPGALMHSKEDDNFFREYMTTRNLPDIFVFGFQELVDLENKKVTAKSFFKSKKKDANEQEIIGHQYRAWRDYLTRCLDDYMPADTTYTLLHTASLVGLFTCIFVKSTVRNRVQHVHSAEVKRGMGGRHGNKGALILRMVLDDSSLCFINCHLAAGQTQTRDRNHDAAEILETESLPSFPLSANSAAQHADVFTSGGDGSMILDHDICILNGDLNYRIDTMGRDTVVKFVNQNDLARLLERDQLLLSRKKNAGNRLRAFQESEIRFAPTYKYDVHSDEYDTSEKRRAPAWCDRILYRGLGKVKMEEYRRWEVRASDHRPVSGTFRLRVKTVDSKQREALWERCQREFQEVRRGVAVTVQLEYLTNVLGLSQKEAKAALEV